MKLSKEFLDDDANLEEIQSYAKNLDNYLRVLHIIEQINTNKDYYLSVNNRKLLIQYLKDYEKSEAYVL